MINPKPRSFFIPKDAAKQDVLRNMPVTRLRLWRFSLYSWHKLHFYKKSNVAKIFFDICNTEMAQSLSSLQKSEFIKLIILIFHVKKLNNKCELDVRVISCNFQVFRIFSFFFQIFQTRLFLNQKQKKYIWVFFPLILCH